MNKLLMFLASAALIMALAACGAKDNKTAGSSSPAPTVSASPTAAASSTPAAGASASPAAPASASPAAAAQPVAIKASNWKFDQKEYKVKKGQPVTISLENTEGVHGVSIKDFSVKLDKDTKSMTFTPDKTGTFTIQCSVMCGTGHSEMKSTLIVE